MQNNRKKSNEVERDVVQEYSDTLSKVGQELFSDFLSDNTRIRQNYLLITSIIAILLAYTLISPVESTDIVGATFKFTNPNVPKFLSAAVCLYFGIVYSICVLQDYEVYKFKTQPGFQIIRVKLNQLLDTMVDPKYVKNIKRMKPKSSLEVIIRDHKSLLTRYNAQISNIENEISSLKSATISSQETARNITRLNSQLKAIVSERKEKIDEHNELVESLREQEINSEQRKNANIVDTAKEKAASLNSVFAKYRLYNAGIVLIEVFFPLALAAFALFSIWSSIYGK